ncbi:hypothetical protein E2C01_040867 [Portunus trituberculatus]|uniref:Uncharacterized protein n=1 Tax=Portunus trituberculatus TaxID=210409 RepID=A0A5B7FKX3_PORTR|nr:hypothetical protein [Portunus trituberculatus]
MICANKAAVVQWNHAFFGVRGGSKRMGSNPVHGPSVVLSWRLRSEHDESHTSSCLGPASGRGGGRAGGSLPQLCDPGAHEQRPALQPHPDIRRINPVSDG